MRVGSGFDVHALVEGRPLMLGGVAIPHSHGLLGHSDADVLLHAVADALLGALALGDLGHWFPPDDPRYADADSAGLLAQVVAEVLQRGWHTTNLDCTVIAERPRLAPYVPAMRERLAAILGVALERVSVKATSTEGLGFTGRGEGIAAQAIVLLEESADA
ncbi:MAG TPA: 2-C-methyl-D-erythritol 2,4-cyclodiphosphate synthase [bacterium]